MEQEKINNILKQDIIQLKNMLGEHVLCLKALSGAQLLISEANKNAADAIKREIDALRKIISDNHNRDVERARAKAEWEKAIALNEGEKLT